MNKLKQFLKQPYPYYDKPGVIIVICSVLMLFIMAVFEPFKFQLSHPSHILLLMCYLIIFLAGTSIVFVFFPKMFPRFYKPDTWTLGKSLGNYLLVLFLLGLSVAFYNLWVLPRYYFYPINNPLPFIVKDILSTIAVGILPFTVITFIIQNRALKQNLAKSMELNRVLDERKQMEVSGDTQITLNGTTKDAVTVYPENILYIEVSGNYVDIFYTQDDKIQHRLLRSTIRQMENELVDYPTFIRCHRTFIVNVNRILHVSGNAQGYKLSLRGANEQIPVSRTYMQNLKDALAKL